MFYIRADGNAEIGTGHVMRCLSIAKAAKKQGITCTFITADKQMEALLNEQGFPMICLDSMWNNLECETDKMAQLIRRLEIKTLLIDSYFVTRDYLETLRGLTRTAYIDDLNAFRYPCDVLVNYNVYADKLDYPARYPDTKLLLGCSYAPLRAEFQNLPPREIRKTARSVLVTTGGADLYNTAGKLIPLAQSHSALGGLTFHIVSGRFNANLPSLLGLAAKYANVTIHQNAQNMSELMTNCDIAVSAGGSTLYELCACGTPAVIFACADNQLDAVTAFSEGYMLGAGDIRNDENACLNGLIADIERLARDYALRRGLSEKCRKLVDGSGAMRIAETLIPSVKSHP